jgi:hypothetical protein
MKQTQKYCPDCGENVLAQSPTANHILHLILTILTLGFWVFAWVLVIMSTIGVWVCTRCGCGNLGHPKGKTNFTKK